MKKLGKKLQARETIEAYKPWQLCVCWCDVAYMDYDELTFVTVTVNPRP